MRIQDVWVRRITGIKTAQEDTMADYLFIRTLDGLIGIWGPISVIQSFLILAFLRPKFINLTVDQALDRMVQARNDRHSPGLLRMACTACNLALWDLRGIAEGVPVSQLFRKSVRSAIPCYASLLGSDISLPPPKQELHSLADSYWGLKWAARQGPEHGAAGLHRTLNALFAIRDQVNGRLMVDAFGRWSAHYAESFLTHSADLKLDWLEEPLPPGDLAAYRELTQLSPTAIAAGEHAYGLSDIRNLVDCGVRKLQPDAGWCGGLDEFDAVLNYAETTNCEVFPHGGGLLPALHLGIGYAAEVMPAIEYHLTVEPKRQFFWREKFFPEGGRLSAPTRPGLGIAIDEAMVETSTEYRTMEWKS